MSHQSPYLRRVVCEPINCMPTLPRVCTILDIVDWAIAETFEVHEQRRTACALCILNSNPRVRNSHTSFFCKDGSITGTTGVVLHRTLDADGGSVSTGGTAHQMILFKELLVDQVVNCSSENILEIPQNSSSTNNCVQRPETPILGCT